MPNRSKTMSPLSSSKQLLEYLDRIAQKDFRLSLDCMYAACNLRKNPQNNFASIHIAGTNGKGSTSAFLADLLEAHGLRVGLMTSPHLIDVCERIQIDRKPIPENILIKIVDTIRFSLPEENYLSYFEMITLAGFEYFSREKIDVAVVETGLGGRLDATNLLQSKLILLTPISLDHQQYLGETLGEIAKEKCGIFKQDAFVISAPQEFEAASVVEVEAEKLGLKLQWALPFDENFELGLRGDYQKVNAGLALAAGEKFLGSQFDTPIERQALSKTDWPGRLQYLQKNPGFLIDSAHNPQGILELVKYLKKFHAKEKIHFLLGALKDKSWKTMFLPLMELAASITCVQPNSERGLPASVLEEKLRSSGKPIISSDEPIAKTVPRLLKDLPERDLLVATGSMVVVGEVLQCFPKHGLEG